MTKHPAEQAFRQQNESCGRRWWVSFPVHSILLEFTQFHSKFTQHIWIRVKSVNSRSAEKAPSPQCENHMSPKAFLGRELRCPGPSLRVIFLALLQNTKTYRNFTKFADFRISPETLQNYQNYRNITGTFGLGRPSQLLLRPSGRTGPSGIGQRFVEGRRQSTGRVAGDISVCPSCNCASTMK